MTIVIIIHALLLFIVFLCFAINSLFKKKQQQSISVSMLSQNEYKQQTQTQKTQQPKPQPKPKPQPVKKTKPVTKKAPTPKPKPEKVWKALDPNQIIKTSKVTKREPVKKQAYKPLKASDIAARLHSNLKNIKFKSSAATSISTLNYYDKIVACLDNLWEQPSRVAVGNTNPSVLIKLTISATGNVISAKIVRKSGIGVMDQSVMRLLSKISTLPRPPDGTITVEANLVLRD